MHDKTSSCSRKNQAQHRTNPTWQHDTGYRSAGWRNTEQHNPGRRRATGLAVAIVLALTLWIAPQQAMGAKSERWETTLHRGDMSVWRQGETLVYRAEGQVVEMRPYDIVRVGANSSATLVSSSKAMIRLGSHAMMEIKPWEQNERRGFLRILFGRIRARLVGLGSGERYDIKSSTSTVGVKGSEWRAFVAGDITVSSCTEHECQVIDSYGEESILPAGATTVSTDAGLGDVQETPTALEEASDDALPPNADTGETVLAAALVEEGLVDAEILQGSEEDSPSDLLADDAADTDQAAETVLETPEVPVDLYDVLETQRQRFQLRPILEN